MMEPIIRKFRVSSRLARHFFNDFLYSPFPKNPRGHILFVRGLYDQQYYNRRFLKWVKWHYPQAMSYMRLGRLSGSTLSLKGTKLVVQWLSYPVKDINPRLYEKAKALEDRARAEDIRIINSIEHYPNTYKYTALNLMRDAGVPTAKCALVKNGKKFNPHDHGLKYPFILRENIFHGRNTYFIRTSKQLAEVKWKDFHQPVAIEFIDTKKKDGLYRKYRYIMMGDVGSTRHCVVSKNWNIHVNERMEDPKAQKIDENYMELLQDPNHEILNKAREALKLDTVAFDYGYDSKRKIVVWEPNPLPAYWSVKNDQQNNTYEQPCVHRLFKMLLEYYFRSAGLSEELENVLKNKRSVDFMPVFLEPLKKDQ